MSIITPPPVFVDEPAGWAYVHQGDGSDFHTLDPENPTSCEAPGCTPQKSALKGGDETPDDETPAPQVEPAIHAAACRHADCNAVGTGATPELALAAIIQHGHDEHGEK